MRDEFWEWLVVIPHLDFEGFSFFGLQHWEVGKKSFSFFASARSKGVRAQDLFDEFGFIGGTVGVPAHHCEDLSRFYAGTE